MMVLLCPSMICFKLGVAQLKIIFVEKLSEFMVSWEAFLYQI